jgi:transcriptional regulator with XRE-family HTH domain
MTEFYEGVSYTHAIAAALRAERAASGKSLDELMEGTAMSKSTIIRTFRGDRAVTAEEIFVLAPLFGLTASELMSRVEERYRQALDQA